MKVQFGCECKDCSVMSQCTHSCAPVAFLVKRDGKKIKVCTRCDLLSDKKIKLLYNKQTPFKPFMDYDSLGAICMLNFLKAKIKEVEGNGN